MATNTTPFVLKLWHPYVESIHTTINTKNIINSIFIDRNVIYPHVPHAEQEKISTDVEGSILEHIKLIKAAS